MRPVAVHRDVLWRHIQPLLPLKKSPAGCRDLSSYPKGIYVLIYPQILPEHVLPPPVGAQTHTGSHRSSLKLPGSLTRLDASSCTSARQQPRHFQLIACLCSGLSHPAPQLHATSLMHSIGLHCSIPGRDCIIQKVCMGFSVRCYGNFLVKILCSPGWIHWQRPHCCWCVGINLCFLSLAGNAMYTYR